METSDVINTLCSKDDIIFGKCNGVIYFKEMKRIRDSKFPYFRFCNGLSGNDIR